MTDPFEVQKLVNAARSTMRVARDDLAATWPRSAAVLARQALELALADHWRAHHPGVEAASMRAQLICIAVLGPGDVAHRTRYVWHALSNACHRHAYDLAPTASELSGWIDEVEHVASALRATASPATGVAR